MGGPRGFQLLIRTDIINDIVNNDIKSMLVSKLQSSIYIIYLQMVIHFIDNENKKNMMQKMQIVPIIILLSGYAMRYFFLKSSLTLCHYCTYCTDVHTCVLYRLVYSSRVQSRTCLLLCYLRVVSNSNFLPRHRQPEPAQSVHLSVWFPCTAALLYLGQLHGTT